MDRYSADDLLALNNLQHLLNARQNANRPLMQAAIRGTPLRAEEERQIRTEVRDLTLALGQQLMALESRFSADTRYNLGQVERFDRQAYILLERVSRDLMSGDAQTEDDRAAGLVDEFRRRFAAAHPQQASRMLRGPVMPPGRATEGLDAFDEDFRPVLEPSMPPEGWLEENDAGEWEIGEFEEDAVQGPLTYVQQRIDDLREEQQQQEWESDDAYRARIAANFDSSSLPLTVVDAMHERLYGLPRNVEDETPDVQRLVNDFIREMRHEHDGWLPAVAHFDWHDAWETMPYDQRVRYRLWWNLSKEGYVDKEVFRRMKRGEDVSWPDDPIRQPLVQPPNNDDTEPMVAVETAESELRQRLLQEPPFVLEGDWPIMIQNLYRNGNIHETYKDGEKYIRPEKRRRIIKEMPTPEQIVAALRSGAMKLRKRKHDDQRMKNNIELLKRMLNPNRKAQQKHALRMEARENRNTMEDSETNMLHYIPPSLHDAEKPGPEGNMLAARPQTEDRLVEEGNVLDAGDRQQAPDLPPRPPVRNNGNLLVGGGGGGPPDDDEDPDNAGEGGDPGRGFPDRNNEPPPSPPPPGDDAMDVDENDAEETEEELRRAGWNLYLDRFLTQDYAEINEGFGGETEVEEGNEVVPGDYVPFDPINEAWLARRFQEGGLREKLMRLLQKKKELPEGDLMEVDDNDLTPGEMMEVWSDVKKAMQGELKGLQRRLANEHNLDQEEVDELETYLGELEQSLEQANREYDRLKGNQQQQYETLQKQTPIRTPMDIEKTELEALKLLEREVTKREAAFAKLKAGLPMPGTVTGKAFEDYVHQVAQSEEELKRHQKVLRDARANYEEFQQEVRAKQHQEAEVRLREIDDTLGRIMNQAFQADQDYKIYQKDWKSILKLKDQLDYLRQGYLKDTFKLLPERPSFSEGKGKKKGKKNTPKKPKTVAEAEAAWLDQVKKLEQVVHKYETYTKTTQDLGTIKGNLEARHKALKQHYENKKKKAEVTTLPPEEEEQYQQYLQQSQQQQEEVQNRLALRPFQDRVYWEQSANKDWNLAVKNLQDEVLGLIQNVQQDVSSFGPVLSTMLDLILNQFRQSIKNINPQLAQDFKNDVDLQVQKAKELMDKFASGRANASFFYASDNKMLVDFVLNPESFASGDKQQAMMHSKLGLYISNTRRLMNLVQQMIHTRQTFMGPVYKNLNLQQLPHAHTIDFFMTHAFPPSQVELKLRFLSQLTPEERGEYMKGPFIQALHMADPSFDIEKITAENFVTSVSKINQTVEQKLREVCGNAGLAWGEFKEAMNQITRIEALILQQVDPKIPEAMQTTQDKQQESRERDFQDLDAGATTKQGGLMTNDTFNPSSNGQITRDKLDDAKRSSYRQMERAYCLALAKPGESEPYIPLYVDPAKFYFSQEDFKALQEQFESMRPLVPKQPMEDPSTYLTKTLAKYGEVLGIQGRITSDESHPALIQQEAIELQTLVSAYQRFTSTTLPAYNTEDMTNGPPENQAAAPSSKEVVNTSIFDPQGALNAQSDPMSIDEERSDPFTQGQANLPFPGNPISTVYDPTNDPNFAGAWVYK